jgi:SAM-dependent methyltransferase
MDENKIRDELKKYDFYHILELTENISTPGWEQLVPSQKVILKSLRSLDIKNKRILDVGCRDGLFSFEAEKLGAGEVIGIDNNLSLGAVNFLIPYFNSKVKMYELNLLDLKPETFGMFDVVLFPGVLYHLRYPFWALKLLKDVMCDGGQIIIETAVFMDDNQHAMLFCPVGSESPYEASSCTFFNLKGLVDTLSSLGLVVQRSEFLTSNEEGNKSFSYLKSCLKHAMKFRPGAVKLVNPRIERVTVLCCKQSSTENTLLNGYWNSIHNTPSGPEKTPSDYWKELK